MLLLNLLHPLKKSFVRYMNRHFRLWMEQKHLHQLLRYRLLKFL